MTHRLLKYFIGVTYVSVIFTTVVLVFFRLISDNQQYLNKCYLTGLLVWLILMTISVLKINKKGSYKNDYYVRRRNIKNGEDFK